MPANNLQGNVSQIVLKEFAKGFTNSNVLVNAVNRQVIQGELNPNTGDSVRLKRPMQYKVERTATGDLTGRSSSNLVSGTIEARISQ
jgi:hypothetical protein